MSEALIRAERLSKSYTLGAGRVGVLHDLDFAADRGDFIAITGRSGSGKSTLLHILGGLDRPSAGRYRFAGEDMAALDDDARARLRARRIGFVFQAFHLLPQLTVEENVSVPFLYRDGCADRAQRVWAALDSVGLAHRARHRPAELSGGEMQRAAIARAIVAGPDLLLADEPTGNLDSETGAEVLSTLERLHAEGTTLVLVTHDPEVARRAPRCVAMCDGRLDG